MKIIDSSGSLKANKPLVTGKGNGASPATPAISATSAVSSASAASTPAAAAQLMSTHGDFDAAKVAEIRASISAGRYVVNTGRIADGLLASAQELVQSQKH